MNKEFVPYEQALALKELGFDEPVLRPNKSFPMYHLTTLSKSLGNGARPTYQQAFRWFREKHLLQHRIWSGKVNDIFYGYDILSIEEQELIVNNSDICGGNCDYDTYEEAEQACLEKLIVIVKKKTQ